MIDVIEKVQQKLLTENVKWQNNLGLEEDEFCDGDKVKKYALTLAPITLPCSNPFSMAWYNDTLICCALNGYTYLKIGESFKMIKVLSVLGRTIFSDIILQGQKYPLVIDGTKKAYKLDNNQLVEIGHIDADYVCNNGETLFYGKGRTVTFSTVNNMTDFVFAIDRAGQIIVEDGYGDIVALATENKNLIIFTKQAIFEFSPVGLRTDYTLKRLETDPLDIFYYSVKDMGDRIAFISNKRLYYYKGGKIYLEQTYLSDNNCSIINSPVVDQRIYYVPMRMNGIDYLFRYDFEKRKHYLVEFDSSYVFDGKYPVCKENKLYQVDLKTIEKPYVYTAGKVTSQIMRKTIVKIIAYVVGNATLTITGDAGRRRIQLTNGLNEKRLHYQSVNFAMDISDKSSDFELKEMQIKYKTRSE